MRLIDADEFIRFIDKGKYCKPNVLTFSENDVCEMIENQPTAYDLDKVLNELELLNPTDYGSIFSYEGHGCARDMKYDAIDIVERGGVDD